MSTVGKPGLARTWLLCAFSLAVLAGCARTSPGARGADWRRETEHYYVAGQVTPENAARLGLAWEFDDFTVRGRTHRGFEATPVVVDGVMYVSGPWSVVYAFDARTGRPLWRYDPEVAGEFARRTCCDVVNRGVAVAGGVVYVGTLDGYLVAIDARTGKPRWKVDTIVDRSRSYAITGAPRVAGKVVVIGNGGAEMGVRGYASAYDISNGKLAWRFWAVPGDPAKGDETPEVTEARRTWDPKSRWDLGGGGTPWDSLVYDPETNIVYIGTGNGMPHPVWSRSPHGGDNLYLSSIVALDADTGRKRWHYQTTPGDSWDYTATQNMILADVEIGGKPRKVIMQAPKNGFFYVLDRVTGKLLSAEKYTTVTWADRVDLKTGRPVFSKQGDFSRQTRLVWPSEAGGHNWPPMAYSEATRLVYIPVLEAPMTFTMHDEPYRPYSGIQGSIASFPEVDAPAADPAEAKALAGQPKPLFQGVLRAWDPVAQKAVWTSKPITFWSGGAMATSSGLVMQGTADGFLLIYDGRTGRLIHRVEIGTGVMAAPMTYTLDGVQYVAVTAGFGGALNGSYPPGAVARERENFERLIVLRIGGGPVRLPPARTVLPFTEAPARYRGGPAAVANGSRLYVQNCARCHGGPDGAGGYPNLWKISPDTHAAFQDIVHDGAFAYAGMASFADVLTRKDIDDIHAFLAQPVKHGTPPPARRALH